ncbi:scavenger receptor cysteine-rich domain superfamily protein-like [Diadema antillarum]|uniref:scavenger receptor cysteine-rich domain superfamily protein-like n=1 Tax=Diadema antillarum TaxID=105358 RepID=UPI003A87FE94
MTASMILQPHMASQLVKKTALPTYTVTDGAVRLVNGPVDSEGRVEYYRNGQWGTVCDDRWDINDAAVVCRQLGYREAWDAPGSAYFGQGSESMPIWRADVDCVGDELELRLCEYDGRSTLDCIHSQDAGVKCSDGAIRGDVRLAGGANPREGYVEVFFDDQWGTVCADSFWSNDDARVVCRQLGFEGGTGSIEDYGSVVDIPILFSSVICDETEYRLIDCYKSIFRFDDCSRTDVTKATCYGGLYGEEGNIRLVDGFSSREGRVELYYNNEWGTVCDDQWGLPDAEVVCSQLGYAGVDNSNIVYFGSGTGSIHMDEVACLGSESRLADCPHQGWDSVSSCSHTEDIGVRCSLTSGDYGDIRLADGLNFEEGRVEIYYNSEWGTVCDDQWDVSDAEVVCRQLGFPGVVDYNVNFVSGSGSILLDDVQCLGSESRLVECSHRAWGSHDCDHTKEVGVRCRVTDDEGTIRLVGDPSPEGGRLEIFHNNKWGTVCDDQWGLADAQVVCRQLGYAGVEEPNTLSSQTAIGSQPIHLNDVECLGHESRLTDCPHSGWEVNNCDHIQDVRLRCSLGSASQGLETWVIAIIVVISLVAIFTFIGIVIAVCVSSAKKKRARTQNTVTAFTVGGGNYPSAAGTVVQGSAVYPMQQASANVYQPPNYTTVMGPATPSHPSGTEDIPMVPYTATNPSKVEAPASDVPAGELSIISHTADTK